MRRWRTWLWPVLTGLVVLSAVLLPPRLSRLGDRQLLGQVHTEVLAAENGLNAQPLDLTERIGLLVRWQEGGEGLAQASQEVEDRAALAALAAAEMDTLADQGALPPFSLDPAELSGERLVFQDAETGGGASFLSVSLYRREQTLWLVLDEESGRLLRLEVWDPLVRKLSPDPEAAGAAFLGRLGVETELLGAGPREALFQVAGTDLTYIVALDDWLLSIRPAEDTSRRALAVDGSVAMTDAG